MIKIFSILICTLLYSATFSQAASINTFQANARQKNRLKVETVEKETLSSTILLEIKITKNNDETKIDFPKIDWNNTKNKSISKYNKIQAFMKMANQEGSNFVYLCGENGFKIVSHNFQITTKEYEIHYYIIEI